MYRLKTVPEDFIVIEQPKKDLLDSSGRYSVCLLKKRNYTTQRALEQIARSLDVRLKDIGFAGTKDKNAITYQFISIRNISYDKISSVDLKDIELYYIGNRESPLSLGDLSGNRFIITVRELEKPLKNIKTQMPNYFGEQRFSKDNKEIGRHIVKSEFKEAIELILRSNSDYKDKIGEVLKSHPNDHVRALKQVPKKILSLYVNAYQSYLWNKTLDCYMELGLVRTRSASESSKKIPLIGFGTEIHDDRLQGIISSLMEEEKISFRDFIVRQIPSISAEGIEREAFVKIRDLRIIRDEKKEIKMEFSLPKGSYATEAVKYLFSS